MNYIRLNSMLQKKKMYLFTFEDIKNLFPGEKVKTIKNNFTRWIDKGYFTRIKRGVYEVTRPEGAGLRMPDLYIANKLYGPSYVSLETVLSIYSIIPDVAVGVTSVTTRPTRTFKNKYGSFFYRTCRSEAFTGYKLIMYDGFKVFMADREKALVDFLYYRLRSGFEVDFGEERLNKKILRDLDWRKVFQYAKVFNRKTVRTLKKCKEYAKC